MSPLESLGGIHMYYRGEIMVNRTVLMIHNDEATSGLFEVLVGQNMHGVAMAICFHQYLKIISLL